MNETIELMKSHTSVRSYTNEIIPKEKLYPIIEAAQMAATSQFVQAYSVIHITDKDVLVAIANAIGNEFIKSATGFLVFCADFARLEAASKIHEKEFHVETMETFMVGLIDASLFAQNVVLGLESAGYGTCFIGSLRNNLHKVNELLALPKHVMPLYGLSFGVPAEKNDPKPRLPLSSIIHENEYNAPTAQQLAEYDGIMAEYYASRNSNAKQTTWTESMSNLMSKPQRPHLNEFVKSKGFVK